MGICLFEGPPYEWAASRLTGMMMIVVLCSVTQFIKDLLLALLQAVGSLLAFLIVLLPRRELAGAL